MNFDDTKSINIEAIELEARKMRAEYTAQLLSSAGAWIASKFTVSGWVGSKTA
ncbi:RSP_7527 family protein [Litoreibacter albidus]|uniref:Uncharacterized protein n=1 Tax=Litoreibacter albidus TaxID=670155 RepID=A0A1H3BAJ6_9RHOB|nr:hypothetical protein [Litoreibacter albidus]SDX38718.1 hypothetical protein SAMN04488001_3106 [Litoreibacter albidus]